MIGNVINNKRQPLSTSVETFSDLKNYKPLFNSQVVNVLGRDSLNDGGGGVFVYNETSELLDDDGTIIDSNLDISGNWQRDYNGLEVNVKWFGAKGNASYDDLLEVWNGNNDTLAFENAIKLEKSIYIPKGVYRIVSNDVPVNEADAKGFFLGSNISVRGAGKNDTSIVMDGVVNGDETTYFVMFGFIDKENSSVKNLEVRGNGNAYEEHLTFSYACSGVNIFGEDCKNITVDNCSFRFIIGHGVQDNSNVSGNFITNNEAHFCSQNGLNVNTKNATIINNKGSFNGFGLIEAACGNSFISNNEAFDNYNNGITVGGFVGVDNQGYGDNNIIHGNKCYRNGIIGLSISIGVRKSTISNNLIYYNGDIGLNCNEDVSIVTNNTYSGNVIYDNGLLSLTNSKLGIYVNSKGNLFTNNTIFNTGVVDGYEQRYGISVAYTMNGQSFINNKFRGHTNQDIEFIGTEDVLYNGYTSDKINLIGDVKFTTSKRTEVVAWDTFPVHAVTEFLTADNISSSKSCILPKASVCPKGKEIIIIDINGTSPTHNITINPNGSDTINGVTSALVVSSEYSSIKIISDGISNWITI